VAYATKQAQEAKIRPTEVLGTIQCESNWNPQALGDGGHSRGLSQIHQPSHPDIAPEQAYDPRFAIDYMVSEMKDGRARQWTCWRNLYS